MMQLYASICNYMHAVNGNFNFGYHCGIASKKANRMLGIIKKTISCKSSDIKLPLYRGLFRPHLEYAVQFWSPHLRKDIDLLERVQHRATKLIQGNSNLDYRDRLKNLNMYTLEEKRLRGDLIQVFKFIKQGDFKGLELNTGEMTRGHVKLF